MQIKNSSFSVRTLALAAVCAFFVACGGGEDQNTDAVTSDTIPAVDDNATVETEDPTYALPSPLQIASIFKKSGLKYIDGITNPEGNMKKYSSNMSKAINLGVYSGDLSYCVLNKQSQKSINYMKTAKQLADQLGMSSVFEANHLGERFEKNVGNEDSLASIIAELQMQTDMFLEDNQQQHISAVVFSGAWIESMYLGSAVYQKDKNKALTGKIVEQMNILGNIVKVLELYKDKDSGMPGLIADMKAIADLYNGFEGVKAAAARPEGEEAPEITITDEEATALTKKIEELRTKFING